MRTGSARELGQSHWCVPGRQSHLSDVHAKRMLQGRLTQWKTGSTVKLARGHSLLKQQTAARQMAPASDTGAEGIFRMRKRGAYGAAGFRTAGERLSIPPNGRQRCQEQQRLVGPSSLSLLAHFSSRQARLLRAAIAFKPALGRHPIPDTAGMN